MALLKKILPFLSKVFFHSFLVGSIVCAVNLLLFDLIKLNIIRALLFKCKHKSTRKKTLQNTLKSRLTGRSNNIKIRIRESDIEVLEEIKINTLHD